MFELRLYNYNKESMRVNKALNLTLYATLNGDLRESTDVLNPSITIEYNTYPAANYAYIPALNRYYFIRDVVSERKNLWRLDMHVDVLMTYAGTKNGDNSTGIFGLSAFVDRCEDSPFTNLTDTLYPMRANASRTRVNAAPVDANKIWEGTSAFLNESNYKYHYMMFFNGQAKNTASDPPYSSAFILGHILMSYPNLKGVMDVLNGQTTLSGKTPADFITALKYYPFELNHVALSVTSFINFPGLWTDLAIPTGGYQSADKQFSFTWKATITAPSSVNHFRNYAPYTNISVTFLPFGRFTLDPSLIFGDGDTSADIYFTVVCDVLSGDAVLYYGTTAANVNIYLGSGNIAIDCPLLASSYSIAKVVSGISSLAGGAVSATAGDLLGAASGVINAASALDANSASMTAGNSKIIDTVPHVDIINHNINGTAPALYGKPMASRSILGGLSGFTKVGSVHVEDLTLPALTAEREEIENLLLSGVIL